jgi:hypothetical protein
MTSAGDHERLPKSNKDDRGTDLTEDQKQVVITEEHIKKLRRGVKLAKTSKVVDRMANFTVEEYERDLRDRSKGKEGLKAPERAERGPKSPVKRKVTRKPLTIPKKDETSSKRVTGLVNAPINVHGDNDMAKIWRMANKGEGGFNMGPRLRKKLRNQFKDKKD